MLSRADAIGPMPPRAASVLDPLGSLMAILIGIALFASPFATYRATRIDSGQTRMLIEALPGSWALIVMALSLAIAIAAVTMRAPLVRLVCAVAGLSAICIGIGMSADYLTPPDNSFARVSPSLGFWFLTLAFTLLLIDALARLSLSPMGRVVALLFGAAGLAFLLWSGAWDNLSILKEYTTRADSFWREGRQHLFLAFGSMIAACLIGIPLGIASHRFRALRTAVLQTLSIVQTIPSIALFGILMAPLGAIAASVPLAAALGIHGIGAAPAFIALFLYALLPIVANTVAGLHQVSPSVVDAARGMGMNPRQRLFGVELPLALPVVLAGIRIVLVQNLGLATVAALIGGGGFGTFVFQGIGQTAIDLVLLGALPTVALSFAASIILDAAVDGAKGALA
ncbi:ABC transporter permease [Microvirga sp. P5_D2]